MSSVPLKSFRPITAPQDQHDDLTTLARTFAQDESRAYTLTTPEGEHFILPESVFELLKQITPVLASGDAVTVVPVGKEVTTQQAANILNISRQYLVRLLNQGTIPHRKVGKHRRVLVEDVLTYKTKRDQKCLEALGELANLTQEFGGYAELASDRDDA